MLELSEMPRGSLEELENLEQLRAIQSGQTILVGVIDQPTLGIDTSEDYQTFVARRKAG